jgi:PKD repeat protein
VPAWGDSTPVAEQGILARLTYDSVLKAYFLINPTTGTSTNQNVIFTDTSFGATSWNWYFGNGASPSTANTKGPHTVTYSSADTVTVKLIVSNGSQSDSMLKKYIISSAPSAAFTYTHSGTTPDTVSFTGPSGSGLLYSWDFGDANSGSDNISTLKNPLHVYVLNGNYLVKLTVTRGNCSSSSSQTISVTTSISAANPAFTASALSGCTNTSITFTQNSSANTKRWNWFFGQDANPQSSTLPGPHTVTYSSSGSKTVTLTVSNGFTQSSSTKTISINDPPLADFTYTGSTASLPATFIFSATQCQGCTYSWDFGDPSSGANTSTQTDVSHDYNMAGTYEITLTVTDANGCSSKVTKEIIFPNSSNQYFTDFTMVPTKSACVGNKVKFTDMSRANSKSRTWYFGSGAIPATSINPDTITVYWTTPGQKIITLVSGSSGLTPPQQTQKSYTYNVTAYPDAEFTVSGKNAAAPAIMTFEAVTGSGYLYSWNFGDSTSGSNTSTSSIATHKYTTSGVYTVTLAITYNGCTSYYARNVYIGVTEPAIIPAFSASPSKNGCLTRTILFTDHSFGTISSWSWNFGSGATPASGSNRGPFTVQYSSTGNKTVSLTVGNGSTIQKATLVIKLR